MVVGAYPFTTREKAEEGQKLILEKFPQITLIQIEKFLEIIDHQTIKDLKRDLEELYFVKEELSYFDKIKRFWYNVFG